MRAYVRSFTADYLAHRLGEVTLNVPFLPWLLRRLVGRRLISFTLGDEMLVIAEKPAARP